MLLSTRSQVPLGNAVPQALLAEIYRSLGVTCAPAPGLIAASIPGSAKTAGRQTLIAELHALFESPQAPSLLINGQRRIGKSWLLQKLTDGALPERYAPVMLDGHRISGACSHAGLFEAIAKQIRQAARDRGLDTPVLDQTALREEPFLVFSDWLEELEMCQAVIWLLLFDEQEHFEKSFKAGILDRDLVLGLLRHIIQHRPGFCVVLAGAHRLSDYPQWLTYLVNLQSRRLGYLSAAETLELVEQFARDFGVEYLESASARIIALTRGHPFWAHALCKEVIAVKNAQPVVSRYSVTDADVDAALPLFFERCPSLYIFLQEDRSPAEQTLLKHIAASPDGLVLESGDASVRHLLDSETIEECAPGRYKVQVELLRLWLRNLAV